jgi:hypothetical protein
MAADGNRQPSSLERVHLGDAGLRQLQVAAGGRFRAGVVLCDGEATLTFADRPQRPPARGSPPSSGKCLGRHSGQMPWLKSALVWALM